MENFLSILTDSTRVSSGFKNLAAGTHEVSLMSYKVGDSFTTYDGQLKDNLPEWSDATPQLIYIVGDDDGATHLDRINMRGYVKFSELTAEQLQSKKFKQAANSDYALTKNNGNIVRVEDVEKTKQAFSMLRGLCASAGIADGIAIGTALDEMVEHQPLFEITIGNKTYNGKTTQEITSFSAVNENSPAF